VEISFKSFAKALRAATEIDPRASGSVPSTKGMLD
jgi:imidazoleglycerol-phosphate dehydratase